MKNHIAVVASSGGKVTKYQDFDLADDAAAHVAAHGGFVAAKPDGTMDYWVVDADKKTLTFDKSASDTAASQRTVMSDILALEAEVTQRRQREAGADDAGGSQAGRDWMKAQEAKIATERGKL
jgi:hypothetical protein